MHARLRGSISLLTLYQIADIIAESHPDKNIKVAAFTVNEKSSNTGTLTVTLTPKELRFRAPTFFFILSTYVISSETTHLRVKHA